MTDDERLKAIADGIEAAWEMGGLSDGLYFEFASAVAKQFAQSNAAHGDILPLSKNVPQSAAFMRWMQENYDTAWDARDYASAAWNASATVEREACAVWYSGKGWLLDEDDVANAMRRRDAP